MYGANAKICFKIYNEIQKKLIEKFKKFGVDDNAKDIARVLRIENTINSRNNKTCKTLFLNDEFVLIEDMAKILPYLKEEVKNFKNQKASEKQKISKRIKYKNNR